MRVSLPLGGPSNFLDLGTGPGCGGQWCENERRTRMATAQGKGRPESPLAVSPCARRQGPCGNLPRLTPTVGDFRFGASLGLHGRKDHRHRQRGNSLEASGPRVPPLSGMRGRLRGGRPGQIYQRTSPGLRACLISGWLVAASSMGGTIGILADAKPGKLCSMAGQQLFPSAGPSFLFFRKGF